MNWKVLVVEDTADDIQLVSTILEHSGVEVAVAGNGREALKMLESIDPTFIITDLSMPVMDGWELLNRLREIPQTAAIPVFAVTAYYSAELGADALKAGFRGFFAKPVNPRNFVQSLEDLLA